MGASRRVCQDQKPKFESRGSSSFITRPSVAIIQVASSSEKGRSTGRINQGLRRRLHQTISIISTSSTKSFINPYTSKYLKKISSRCSYNKIKESWRWRNKTCDGWTSLISGSKRTTKSKWHVPWRWVRPARSIAAPLLGCDDATDKSPYLHRLTTGVTPYMDLSKMTLLSTGCM